MPNNLRTQYWFVYGTLMKGFCLNDLLRDEKYISTAYTRDKFSMYSIDDSYPIIILNKSGYPVAGECYKVCSHHPAVKEIENIELEAGYSKIKVPVVLEDKSQIIEAFCFVFSMPVSPYARPVPPVNGVLSWRSYTKSNKEEKRLSNNS